MNELDIKYHEMGMVAVVEAARNEITALCETSKKWRMSVPVRWDDSDVLITQAIMMLEADNSKLREHIERIQASAKGVVNSGNSKAYIDPEWTIKECEQALSNNAPLEDAPAPKSALWIDTTASDTPCSVCGGEVVEFSVPNDIWNSVVRKNGPEKGGEYWCVACFLSEVRVTLDGAPTEDAAELMTQGARIMRASIVDWLRNKANQPWIIMAAAVIKAELANELEQGIEWRKRT